jgi:hypothetical protein
MMRELSLGGVEGACIVHPTSIEDVPHLLGRTWT